MRPCRQCRSPIENSAATCPHCSAVQTDEPKANSETKSLRPGVPRVNTETEAPPRLGYVQRVLADLIELVSLGEPLGCVILSLPLALGGASGYLIAEGTGAIVGVVVGGAFIIGVVALSELGG